MSGGNPGGYVVTGDMAPFGDSYEGDVGRLLNPGQRVQLQVAHGHTRIGVITELLFGKDERPVLIVLREKPDAEPVGVAFHAVTSILPQPEVHPALG